jgi:hypothetical protein
MSTIPILTAVRLIPREEEFLDRKVGSFGEIFYDRDSNSLRLYNGRTAGGVALAKADMSNVSNADFLAKSVAAGIGGGGSGGSFELTIAGDDSTIRTVSSGNVLKFVGSGGITTATTVDGEITISGQNTFSTIVVAGESNVVADSATDSLTLVAGTGISITTNASTDTITITNSSAVVNEFTDLEDSAGLTVDKFYLPAITMLTVSNNGASAYRFDQYGTTDNPTIYAINGTTIAFNLVATGHPFLIQTPGGLNYNVGLIHVSTDGVVSTGVNAQGKDSGTLYWKILTDISGGYRYQCGSHAPMVGSIFIKTFSTL